MSDATLRAALAERGARAGGVVARERFRDELAIETKSNKNDYVTEADRDAQRQVVATIRQEFPDAVLIGEEETEQANTGTVDLRKEVPETGRAWVIDPIDGTNNYVRGMRFWGTSVAAVVDQEPVGVATYMPAVDDLFAAGPESVSLNGDPISVSDRTDPETFNVGLIGWWPARNKEQRKSILPIAMDRFGDFRRLGSMQGVLALVAAGSLDAAFTPKTPQSWDSIAGTHLIRRAGGTVTDIYGDRWTNGDDGLVVSNGNAHDVVLEAVQAGVAPETAD